MAIDLNIEAGAAWTYPQEVRMKADKARGTDVWVTICEEFVAFQDKTEMML